MRLFKPLAVSLVVGASNIILSLPVWAEEAHGAGHSPVFPPFDATKFGSQFVWLVILFGLLYRVLSRSALPRIAETMANRKAQVDRDIASATDMQKKAEAAEASYQQSLAKAKADAQLTAQTAKDAANAEAEKRRMAIETDLSQRLVKAESDIGAMKAQAMGNVASIALGAAADIVARLTGKNPVAADLKAAVDAAVKG